LCSLDGVSTVTPASGGVQLPLGRISYSLKYVSGHTLTLGFAGDWVKDIVALHSLRGKDVAPFADMIARPRQHLGDFALTLIRQLRLKK
jgi:hypothetical protein